MRLALIAAVAFLIITALAAVVVACHQIIEYSSPQFVYPSEQP